MMELQLRIKQNGSFRINDLSDRLCLFKPLFGWVCNTSSTAVMLPELILAPSESVIANIGRPFLQLK